MFGSQMLEVAIGVIFVFVLVGILCFAIREGIEAWLKTRAAFLERGIRELLHDVKAEGIAKSFYCYMNGKNHLQPILTTDTRFI